MAPLLVGLRRGVGRVRRGPVHPLKRGDPTESGLRTLAFVSVRGSCPQITDQKAAADDDDNRYKEWFHAALLSAAGVVDRRRQSTPALTKQHILEVQNMQSISRIGVNSLSPGEVGASSPTTPGRCCALPTTPARLRDIAAMVGVTERSAHDIVTDLVDAGYVVKDKAGRRNRYRIQEHLPLQDPISRQRTIGEMLDLLVGTNNRRQGQTPQATDDG